jgi:hypothetical protein
MLSGKTVEVGIRPLGENNTADFLKPIGYTFTFFCNVVTVHKLHEVTVLVGKLASEDENIFWIPLNVVSINETPVEKELAVRVFGSEN